MSSAQVSAALNKEAHPEVYCPARKCLWRTGGGYCPRHPEPVREHSRRITSYPKPSDYENRETRFPKGG